MVTKSGRLRWAGHAAHTGGEDQCVHSFGRKTGKQRDHLKGLSVNGG